MLNTADFLLFLLVFGPLAIAAVMIPAVKLYEAIHARQYARAFARHCAEFHAKAGE